jgi:NAD(P)-dependent dehydrogenase (short-subunit alcohol dehydrogenase family)
MARSIFITGGGSGIGRAAAQLFAARGWFVGIADINNAGLNETAASLPTGTAHLQTLDVRDRQGWDAALARFAEAAPAGGIDVVFNNAGIGVGGTLDQLDRDEIDALIDVNIRGVVYGAQAAYPYLRHRTPGAALINMSSAAGIYGTGGLALYSATKSAVRGLSEALDLEWRADRIAVRVLMPGFVDTPILDPPNNRKWHGSRRENIVRTGFPFVSTEIVAEAAWDAVHDAGPMHRPIGSVARQLTFGARWMPHMLRRRLLRIMDSSGLISRRV